MTSSNLHRNLAVAASIVVAGAVIAGLASLDSPARQRQQRLDERRIQDLREIQSAMNVYFQAHGALPQDLPTLASSLRIETADPDTRSPYGYEIVDSERFRLCAVFSRDSREEPDPPYYARGLSWAHGAGRVCFELKVSRGRG